MLIRQAEVQKNGGKQIIYSVLTFSCCQKRLLKPLTTPLRKTPKTQLFFTTVVPSIAIVLIKKRYEMLILEQTKNCKNTEKVERTAKVPHAIKQQKTIL